MLIKPKQITLVSNLDGKSEEFIYNIGRYSALDGLDMIEYVTDILKSGVNFSGTKKGLLRECLIRMGKYIEAVRQTPEGEKCVILDNPKMLEVAIPDGETAMALMVELHNYNTFFLKTDSILRQSSYLVNLFDNLLQGILTKYVVPLSQKDSQPTEN